MARQRSEKILVRLAAFIAGLTALYLFVAVASGSRPYREMAEPLPPPPPLPDSVWTDRVFEWAEESWPVNTLLVAHRDTLIYEHYFGGMRPDRKVNVKSASKSIMSALVGIALQKGYLDSLGQRVEEFFPEYFTAAADSIKRTINLEHLVTMTAGLEGTSFENYNPWILSRNWVRYALSQPVVASPGSRMDYSTGNSHLLSVILTKQSGMSTLAFARRYLFEPIGASLPAWDRDPQGYYLGGNNMSLTPEEMLAFGQLYLHGGMVGDRRVLPEEWIERSWNVRTYSLHTGAGYGYGWWHRSLAGEDVWYALGYGGQYVFVIPELESTVVITSSLESRGRRRSRRRSPFSLVSYRIIPAIRDRVRIQNGELPATPAEQQGGGSAPFS